MCNFLETSGKLKMFKVGVIILVIALSSRIYQRLILYLLDQVNKR